MTSKNPALVQAGIPTTLTPTTTPLTPAEVERLLDFIKKDVPHGDWEAAAKRLIQAIPDMVCPLSTTKDAVLKKAMQLLWLLATSPGKESTPEMVASVMKLIR